MKKIVLMLLASASMAFGDTLVMTPVTPGSGEHMVFTIGRKYPVVVYFKCHTKRYYVGTFTGYVAVTDSNHRWSATLTDWKRTGKPEQVAMVDSNTAKNVNMSLYRVFKGEHSTLLYAANENWFIVEK
jgi:hypothetical protein